MYSNNDTLALKMPSSDEAGGSGNRHQGISTKQNRVLSPLEDRRLIDAPPSEINRHQGINNPRQGRNKIAVVG